MRNADDNEWEVVGKDEFAFDERTRTPDIVLSVWNRGGWKSHNGLVFSSLANCELERVD